MTVDTMMLSLSVQSGSSFNNLVAEMLIILKMITKLNPSNNAPGSMANMLLLNHKCLLMIIYEIIPFEILHRKLDQHCYMITSSKVRGLFKVSCGSSFIKLIAIILTVFKDFHEAAKIKNNTHASMANIRYSISTIS